MKQRRDSWNGKGYPGRKQKEKKHVNAVVLFYLFGVSFLIIVFKRMAFFVKQKSSNYMKN